ARSFAAPAATRGIARTPEFRHLTRLSAIDVIINGKSFSPPGSCARDTGESNGPQYRANRVRAPDARRTARRAGCDVCPGSSRPTLALIPPDLGCRIFTPPRFLFQNEAPGSLLRPLDGVRHEASLRPSIPFVGRVGATDSPSQIRAEKTRF